MPEKVPAGYIRVSSDEQAQHGISVEAQRDILKAWGVMRQSPAVRIYEDPGFSGKSTDRPALQRLLADVRAGQIAAVVVWKLDRLSRSLRDTLAIIEDVFQPAGVTLHSVTESIDTGTPSGRMMLNILASFAQLEREQDSDRVVMAHKHLARDCRYLGGHVALGYRIDDTRHFQLDPVAAPIVRRVFEMYLARSGYTPILDYLNAQPLTVTRRRSPWGKSDLNYLLANEIYAGTYIRRLGSDKRSKVTAPEVIRVPGGVPAILTPDEWARVCAMRAENRRQSALYKSGTVYPLSGLARCGVCGQLMLLHYGGKARDGARERYYLCRARCVPAARRELLEAAVYQIVEDVRAFPDLVRQASAVANTYAEARAADNASAAAPARADLIRVRKRIAQITDYIAEAGSAAPRSLMADLQRLEAEETTLLARIETLSRPVAVFDSDILIAALSACQNLKNRPPQEVKPLLQAAIRTVLVHPDRVEVSFRCSLCGGDDPPAHILHQLPFPPQKKKGPKPPLMLTVRPSSEPLPDALAHADPLLSCGLADAIRDVSREADV